jgi:hypothetical protein
MVQMENFSDVKCEKSVNFDDYGTNSHCVLVYFVRAVPFLPLSLLTVSVPPSEEAQSSASEVGVMTSSVKESSFCATFEIPRRATIFSDSKPHKVRPA